MLELVGCFGVEVCLVFAKDDLYDKNEVLQKEVCQGGSVPVGIYQARNTSGSLHSSASTSIYAYT